jgi:very-short-patch-repair endonuclease
METVNDTISQNIPQPQNDYFLILSFLIFLSTIFFIHFLINKKKNRKKETKSPIIVSVPSPKPILPKPVFIKPNIYKPETVGYLPNNIFFQEIEYTYPVVKMPAKDCIIKFSKIGRSNKIGFKENYFFEILKKHFSLNFQVLNDRHIPQKNNSRPYEPDFILINENKNILINIEIDEPYDGFSGVPTHILNRDNYRDLFFTNRGYIVIRFSEKQIHEECLKCCALISKVISSIDSEYKIPSTIEIENSNSENQWDSLQAKNWAKIKYRENYLGIESFGIRNEIGVEYNSENSEIDNIIENQIIEEKKPFINQNTPLDFLEKKNQHSNDKTIVFIPETHQYLINGNPDTISVSQLIDKFFPEFDAIKAATNLNRKHKYFGLPVEEIVKMWKSEGLEQAELGTKLHLQIENFYNQKEYNDDSIEFKYFLNFTRQFPTMVPFRTEWRIYDEKLLIAGTIDMVYKKEDGQLFMFDWKRSKKVVNNDGTPSLKDPSGNYTEFAFDKLNHLTDDSYYRYCLQQNIYRHILEKNYNVTISSINLLILHPIYDKYHLRTLPRMDDEVKYIFQMANEI